ncbi:MAG: hypothetical protein CMP07_10230 [Xanthomonadales bacterium]|nr:hypothetical protein [Xanthomonadales bacterium]
MKFLPGPRENTAVIEPESFEAPIRVDGISPEVMAGLFRGSNAARSHWHPPLEITAGLTGADDVATGEPYEKDLPDGRGILHTGAPGSVRIETHHRLAGDMLQPQSLYLLLAQQWARAGLMLVHGAAFELDGVGVLALGDKGAGKSVLTAAALAAGARVVSDDWVMVGLDGDGRLEAERLREFLMLRHGQACDRLMDALPNLRPAPLANRPKTVFHIGDQPESVRRQFITTCSVDRIWLLKRPSSGRFQPSARTPASPVQALSALIQATMPLLFSGRFAHESAELRKTTDAASSGDRSGSRLSTVRTGPDLLDQPETVLAALL